MTKYIVHIFREMRITFGCIEADSPEAAATIAREQPTRDADDITDCEGENLGALIDVAGDEDFGRSVMIDFEGERQRKAASNLLAALEGAVFALDENRDGSGPSKQTAIANADAAIAEAKAAGLHAAPTAPHQSGIRPYSVLLLYPDYIGDWGTETYYAFVEARDQIEAVEIAQRQAVAAQDAEIGDPADFVPLLVTQGHHASEPLFNK